jgi:hypothetical protein
MQVAILENVVPYQDLGIKLLSSWYIIANE